MIVANLCFALFAASLAAGGGAALRFSDSEALAMGAVAFGLTLVCATVLDVATRRRA